MKIRTGFVSNSSTCSFIICGYQFSEKIFYQDILQKLLGITTEGIMARMKINNYYKDKQIEDSDIEDYCADWIYDINFKNDGIDVQTGEGIDRIIIGIRIAEFDKDTMQIENSKTSLQKLQEQMKIIGELLGIDVQPKIYTGSYNC